MEDLQYKILKTELDHYKNIVKSLCELSGYDLKYSEIQIPNTHISLNVLDYKAMLSVASMDVYYFNYFKEIFQNDNYINTWVEKSSFIRNAKNDLKEKFISPYDFKKKLEQYIECNKLNNWEIKFTKKKNNKGNTVTHFFIKK